MKNIEYADKSWNPISGCTHYGKELCAVWKVCWAHSMSQRLKGRFGYDSKEPFKPTLHKNKLLEPYKWREPKRIDTCFMGDLFCSGVAEEWIEMALKVIEENPNHRFYLLTKNPSRMREFVFPKNAWAGVTVNRQSDVYRIHKLKMVNASIKYVSLEPFYEKIDADFSDIDWVILGAQTRPEYQPEKEWVEHILKLVGKKPVFMKDNLKWEKKRCEFPSEPFA